MLEVREEKQGRWALGMPKYILHFLGCSAEKARALLSPYTEDNNVKSRRQGIVSKGSTQKVLNTGD